MEDASVEIMGRDGQLQNPEVNMWYLSRPVQPRMQFPCKTIREKVPHEGRTRQSDRAGKTRTALLEMRTALLETSAAKSMRVNGKHNILLLTKFVLSTMSHESEHSESEFYYPGKLSHAELLQLPTHSESKERNYTDSSQLKKLTTFSETKKQTGSQGNTFSG